MTQWENVSHLSEITTAKGPLGASLTAESILYGSNATGMACVQLDIWGICTSIFLSLLFFFFKEKTKLLSPHLCNLGKKMLLK